MEKKILVTGAGGFIGSKLAFKLAQSEKKVRALYHSKINSEWGHSNIEFVKGNILDKENLIKISENCESIFHVAALANNWAKNANDFYEVNVIGTENIIEAAKKTSVRKIIFTSTAGTIGPAVNSLLVHEDQKPFIHFSDYEKSKAEAENRILYHVKMGLNAVIVNPTRVFGPGELSKSNAVTRIIQQYIKGKWKYKIGNGEHIGNYAFIDDIVTGHILALEKGKIGERYILGGNNLSFNNFIKIISQISGIKNNLVPVPIALIGAYAFIEDGLATVFGIEPKITFSWVKKYKANWTTSLEKATRELDYEITPTEEAVKKTIDWLKTK